MLPDSFFAIPLLTAFLACAQSTTASIDLNVVATNSAGAPQADLKQSDFTVLDNKNAQQITSFRALSLRDPVRITVVIDAVNVTFSNVAYQRDQVTKFLLANGGNLGAPTQIAVFTDEGVQLLGDFSTNGQELSGVLSHHDIGLRDVRRSSQFEVWDRLNLSLTALRTVIAHEAELPGRKMVLWVSPGWPLLSGPGIELNSKQQDQLFADVVNLSTAMRQAQVVLYNINPFGAGENVGRALYYEDFVKPVNKPNQVQLGDLSLQVLSVQSGGLTLVGSNDTAGMIAQCARDAHASYEISYVPSAGESPSRYHLIQVQVNQPGLKTRTRQGYYAAR